MLGRRFPLSAVGSEPLGQPSSDGEDTRATQVHHMSWCSGRSDDGELGSSHRMENTTALCSGPTQRPGVRRRSLSSITGALSRCDLPPSSGGRRQAENWNRALYAVTQLAAARATVCSAAVNS